MGAGRGAVVSFIDWRVSWSNEMAKSDRKRKALYVTAERLEGSPPPELPTTHAIVRPKKSDVNTSSVTEK